MVTVYRLTISGFLHTNFASINRSITLSYLEDALSLTSPNQAARDPPSPREAAVTETASWNSSSFMAQLQSTVDTIFKG